MEEKDVGVISPHKYKYAHGIPKYPRDIGKLKILAKLLSFKLSKSIVLGLIGCAYKITYAIEI